jgi:hypothetical protein
MAVASRTVGRSVAEWLGFRFVVRVYLKRPSRMSVHDLKPWAAWLPLRCLLGLDYRLALIG